MLKTLIAVNVIFIIGGLSAGYRRYKNTAPHCKWTCTHVNFARRC